jgi:transglutaminase-like putative cysteine protease
MYQDHHGNVVHHFNVPGRHSQLTVNAEALVASTPLADLPAALGPDGWAALDRLTVSGEFWDLLNPSPFTRASALLDALAQDIHLARGDDPLATLRRLMSAVYGSFEYCPQSTQVDSPIDHALKTRQGFCQDFAHIMIALVRRLGVPCRYISGYLFQENAIALRSSAGATHAWVEALLPGPGWVGFDPTNDVVAGEGHIRVALGRDYADVPPTRGVYKGASRTDLAVGVSVALAGGTNTGETPPFVPWMSREAAAPLGDADAAAQSQQ